MSVTYFTRGITYSFMVHNQYLGVRELKTTNSLVGVGELKTRNSWIPQSIIFSD